MEEKPPASKCDANYHLKRKYYITHEYDGHKDFTVPKEEPTNTTLHLDTTVLGQQSDIPIKIEIEQNTCKIANYLIEPKEEMLDDPKVTLDDDKDFIVPKEELSKTSLHLDTTVLDQPIDIPIKIETEQNTCKIDANYLIEPKEKMFGDPKVTLDDAIEPKQEMLGDPEVTLDDEKDFIVPKEELSNTSLHFDQHIIVSMVLPIKTETMLSKEIAELQKAVSSSNDMETINDTGGSTFMRTHVKREPSQADASLGKSQLINDKQTVTSLTSINPQFSSITLQTLVSHTTSQKPYHCKHCDYVCLNSSNLKIHMRKHMSKTNLCKHCDYKCTKSNDLKVHMRTHTGEKPYVCQHCDYKSTSARYLKIHTMIHTGEKPYACEHCDYKCSTSWYLKIHMRTHTDAKPYFCEHCDYKSSKSYDLKIHMRKHTGEKPFVCMHCDYKCSTARYLKMHIRTHTGEKPYACAQCDYTCATSIHLKTHMRSHTGLKPYLCELCDYKGSKSCDLKIHMRTHTGEKPYICVYCDYKCSNSRYLKIHVRTHTGEKPYACKECDFKCTTSTYLKVHMRIHTGEKPYRCEHCDFKCKILSGLKCHMMTRHPS
ncbi:zinc finger protein ZFP2-like [Maniola hyperantus]|uniref:zinc finger protein ZFP2-like n=1 Tax=Aphantopus hyperantus TaxID=2795564 RepID=UPI002143DE1C